MDPKLASEASKPSLHCVILLNLNQHWGQSFTLPETGVQDFRSWQRVLGQPGDGGGVGGFLECWLLWFYKDVGFYGMASRL